MKLLSLCILALILNACSHAPKRVDSYITEVKSPVTRKNFSFSDLVLITKLNHATEEVEECHGLIRETSEREEVENLFLKNKTANTLTHDEEVMAVFSSEDKEYILYQIKGDEDLELVSKDCQRLVNFFKQEGYSSSF